MAGAIKEENIKLNILSISPNFSLSSMVYDFYAHTLQVKNCLFCRKRAHQYNNNTTLSNNSGCFSKESNVRLKT